MEKKIIPPATLKEIFKFRPTLKIFYDEDRTSNLIEDRIKPYYIPDEAIEKFIETSFDWKTFHSRKKLNPDLNLNGYGLFYIRSCLSLIRDYCTFERLKRILERYIEIERERWKLKPGDRTELIENLEDNFYSTEFLIFERFSDLVIETCSKDEIREIEKVIDKNYDVFLQYEFYFYNSREQHADLYFDRLLQRYFPFSKEFICKYHNYFLINDILENPVTKNFDMQKYIFKTILPSNLKNHLIYYTRQSEYHDFVLSEETVDGLVLKYNLK